MCNRRHTFFLFLDPRILNKFSWNFFFLIISQRLLILTLEKARDASTRNLPSFFLMAIKILIVSPSDRPMWGLAVHFGRRARHDSFIFLHVNKSAGICGSSENHECQDCSTSRVPVRQVTSSNNSVIFALALRCKCILAKCDPYDAYPVSGIGCFSFFRV